MEVKGLTKHVSTYDYILLYIYINFDVLLKMNVF